MKTCFNSPFKVTQEFGKEFMYQGKPYYARYGLKGHNGIDLIPKDYDKTIFNILEGEIICLELNNTYGNRVGVWNKQLNLVEFHNHLEFINSELMIGQEIKGKVILGKMGNTGFSLGAHNHYAMCEVDNRCQRINLNNGFKGWIDPLPFLRS